MGAGRPKIAHGSIESSQCAASLEYRAGEHTSRKHYSDTGETSHMSLVRNLRAELQAREQKVQFL